MLARYLRSQDRPVRYALNTRDPALMEAIRNYLGINLRAEGIPRMTQNDEYTRGMHAQHPVIGHTFNSLMQHGHPSDLMAYLDLMEQHGGVSHGVLQNMANLLATDAAHPNLMQQYGQPAVESHGLRQAIGQRLPVGMSSLVGSLFNAMPEGHPLQRSLAAIHRTLLQGSYPHHRPHQRPGDTNPSAVAALIRGHDVGHALASGMQDLAHSLPQASPLNAMYGHTAPHVLRDLTGNVLNDTVRRYLSPEGV